ncbi:hypothetical protein AQJ66_04315, partial [Streptomyces bungoensis]
MLMPSPAVLRGLVEEYETLLAEETLAGAAEPSPRLRDLGYTLCVSTGTREIRGALAAARAHLATTASAPAPPAAPRSDPPADRPGPATASVIALRPGGHLATPAAEAPLAAGG